jgi:MFS family permease
MAVMVVMLGSVAVYLIEADPSARGLNPDGAPHAAGPPVSAKNDQQLLPILRSRPFTQFYAAQAIIAIPVFVPFVHLVPFAEDLGIPRAQAVGALGLIGLGSTAGRFIVGGLADRFGRRQTLVLLFGGIALSYGIWLAAGGIIALACFAVWFGLCYGGYVALSPALLADYFSGPKLSSVIGLQYTAGAFGSLLGPILAGYLYDVSGAYTSTLYIGAACSIGAFCLILTMPERAHGSWSR